LREDKKPHHKEQIIKVGYEKNRQPVMKYIFSDKKTRKKRKAGLESSPCFYWITIFWGLEFYI